MDAGSPGIQKQIVKSESLKGMEGRYERVLQELAEAIKVNMSVNMSSPESSNIFTPKCCLFLCRMKKQNNSRLGLPKSRQHMEAGKPESEDPHDT